MTILRRGGRPTTPVVGPTAPYRMQAMSYTGDGALSRIVPLNSEIDPEFLVIRAADFSVDSIYKIKAGLGYHAANESQDLGGGTKWTDRITDMGPGFVEVSGSGSSDVNQFGWEYLLYAFERVPGGDEIMQLGSYSGNGTTPRSFTGLGFAPDFVLVTQETLDDRRDVWNITGSTNSRPIGTQDRILIIELDPDGFTIRRANYNTVGRNYFWMAFKSTTGICGHTTPTGTGTPTTIDIDPGALASVYWHGNRAQQANTATVFRHTEHNQQESSRIISQIPVTDGILALNVGSIDLGTNDDVNRSGGNGFYMGYWWTEQGLI